MLSIISTSLIFLNAYSESDASKMSFHYGDQLEYPHISDERKVSSLLMSYLGFLFHVELPKLVPRLNVRLAHL